LLYLTLPLPYRTLPCLTSPHLTLTLPYLYLTFTLPLPYRTLPYLSSPHLTVLYLYLTFALPLPYLTLPYRSYLTTLPCLTVLYLYLTLPYLYLTLPVPYLTVTVLPYLAQSLRYVVSSISCARRLRGATDTHRWLGRLLRARAKAEMINKKVCSHGRKRETFMTKLGEGRKR